MKLFVPRVGTELQLTADWTFTVIPEYRNVAACNAVGISDRSTQQSVRKPVTLPAGTSLVVDRIYIRQPNKSGEDNDYDSMTFFIRTGGCSKHLVPGARFFARLDDCNKIEYTFLGENRASGFAARAQFKREAAGNPEPKPKTTLDKSGLCRRNGNLLQMFDSVKRLEVLCNLSEKFDQIKFRDDMIAQNELELAAIRDENLKQGRRADWIGLGSFDPGNRIVTNYMDLAFNFRGKYAKSEDGSTATQRCSVDLTIFRDGSLYPRWHSHIPSSKLSFVTEVTFEMATGKISEVFVILPDGTKQRFYPFWAE